MNEILAIIGSIVTALPLGAWLSSVVLKRKYQVEIDQLKATVEASKADTRSTELDNVRKAMEIVMANIVEPLKKEINALRRDIRKFQKAVDQVGTCKYSDNCPVKHELQCKDTDDSN